MENNNKCEEKQSCNFSDVQGEQTTGEDTYSNNIKVDDIEGHAGIIERLDLQLLLAVIVFFVSGWAYLNKTICAFTGSESSNYQMSYILVHYILTVTLILCLYITYLKGRYLLNKSSIGETQTLYFKFFMSSWLKILLICFAIFAITSIIDFPIWWFYPFLILSVLVKELKKLKAKPNKIVLISILLVFCFPLFISTMTSIDKKIEVILDKEYYHLDDDIVISVSAKGYACDLKVVCLGEKCLYPNSKYEIRNNMIILKPYMLKGDGHKRSVEIGTVTPVAGLKNFFSYPFRKIIYSTLAIDNHQIEYSVPVRLLFPEYNYNVFYTSTNVNVVL